MAVIFIRSTIIYIALLIIMRLMGKRQIGEMQPFEFTVTLLISDLACIPMSDSSIPLLYGAMAILAVFILHQVMTLLDKASTPFKFLLSGKPSIVIDKNGVDFNQLKRNNMDVSDLIESMRILGYFSLDSVKFAIYESNGTLSAIENDNLDFEPSLPFSIIKNGKIDSKNLAKINKTKSEIYDFIKNLGSKRIKDVGILTIDGNGRYYFQQYNKKFKSGYTQLKEEVKW